MFRGNRTKYLPEAKTDGYRWIIVLGKPLVRKILPIYGTGRLEWFFEGTGKLFRGSPKGFGGAAGGGAIVLLSLLWRGRERFLPRYAFYAFYPGHLLLLALIRALWVSVA